MTDPDTIIEPHTCAWYRQFYRSNKYEDIERWTQKACAASKVIYAPPCIKYADAPAEYWNAWEEGVG